MSKELDQQIAKTKQALSKLEIEKGLVDANQKVSTLTAQVTALRELLEQIVPLQERAIVERDALQLQKDSQKETEYW
jgi:hypothetical protein